MKSTVSVIIPTHNRAKFLMEALESVYSQTFKPFEIIVVDDGSTDNTRTALSKSEFNVKYVYQKNSGPAAARNRGISEAKGEWIAFLDADDAWLPGKLAMQLEFIRKNPDVAMVCGKTLPWNSNAKDESGSLKKGLKLEIGNLKTQTGENHPEKGASLAKHGLPSGFRSHPSESHL